MPKCVMCGQPWGQYDRGYGYVEIGGDAVCDEKCKWEYIEESFEDYLKKNNILQKAKEIQANPNLDAVIALKRELIDASATETGESADTNFIGQAMSPLYDLEDVLKRGLTEYVAECTKELVEGVEAIVNRIGSKEQ